MKSLSPGFWIISIALVLCFSMPCYAQLETQRFFTPEGTRWKINTYPDTTELGFLGGSIYLCDNNSNCNEFEYSNYKNQLISKFDAITNFDIGHGLTGASRVTGYIIPFLKYGKMSYCVSVPFHSDKCFNSTLTKIDDNFSPIP
jgi:hypothetical protein